MVPDFASAWHDFVAGPRTLGPTEGAREAWHKGRRRYAAWVLRVRDERVDERVRALQAALSGHLADWPLSGLHVTLYVAGFPTSSPEHDDDVHVDALEAAVDALRGAERPRVRVGAANSFLSCPVLEVQLDEAGYALRDRLAAAHREVRFAPYRPHLTLGTWPGRVPVAPLVEALTPWRDLPEITVRVDELELATFDAWTEGAPLEPERVVRLGRDQPRDAQ